MIIQHISTHGRANPIGHGFRHPQRIVCSTVRAEVGGLGVRAGTVILPPSSFVSSKRYPAISEVLFRSRKELLSGTFSGVCFCSWSQQLINCTIGRMPGVIALAEQKKWLSVTAVLVSAREECEYPQAEPRQKNPADPQPHKVQRADRDLAARKKHNVVQISDIFQRKLLVYDSMRRIW